MVCLTFSLHKPYVMKLPTIPSRYTLGSLRDRILNLAADAKIAALSLDILGILLLVATLAPAVKPNLSPSLVDSVDTIDLNGKSESFRKVKYDYLYAWQEVSPKSNADCFSSR